MSELQVIKNRGWRGVQEERKKQEIKDEGHFIGLMRLGDTVKKKVGFKGEEMGKLREKVSNTAVYRCMHVLNRSVLLCLEVTCAQRHFVSLAVYYSPDSV